LLSNSLLLQIHNIDVGVEGYENLPAIENRTRTTTLDINTDCDDAVYIYKWRN
jgi:hypothetical protein